MVTFGERLDAAMKDAKWNAATLAKKTGLDPGAISRHRRQAHAPSTDSIDKYAAALGVRFDWLAYGRGDQRTVATSEQPTAAPHVPLLGLAALESVLETYVWPPRTDLDTIDSICEDARLDAATPRGAVRPVSAWRVYLERRLTTQPISRMPATPRAVRGT